MIRLLKQGNGFVQIILTIVAASLPFVIPFDKAGLLTHSVDNTPLSLLNAGIPGAPWQALIMSALLAVVAILHNLQMRQARLIHFKSGFAGLLFVILSAIMLGGKYEPDFLICLLAMVIVLTQITKVPESHEGYQEVFLSSFILGLAAFIMKPFLYGFLFLFGFLLVYRIYNWRNWLIIIIGQVTAHLFIFTWYFWFDRLEDLRAFYFGALPNLSREGFITAPLVWIPAAFIILMGVFGVGVTLRRLADRKIILRGHLLLYIWIMLFFLIAVLVYDHPIMPLGVMLTFPVSALLAVRFTEDRRAGMTAAVFYIILLVYGIGFFF